jgi:hypothetical protein
MWLLRNDKLAPTTPGVVGFWVLTDSQLADEEAENDKGPPVLVTDKAQTSLKLKRVPHVLLDTLVPVSSDRKVIADGDTASCPWLKPTPASRDAEQRIFQCTAIKISFGLEPPKILERRSGF